MPKGFYKYSRPERWKWEKISSVLKGGRQDPQCYYNSCAIGLHFYTQKNKEAASGDVGGNENDVSIRVDEGLAREYLEEKLNIYRSAGLDHLHCGVLRELTNELLWTTGNYYTWQWPPGCAPISVLSGFSYTCSTTVRNAEICGGKNGTRRKKKDAFK